MDSVNLDSNDSLHTLALQKISRGVTLSADEYRSLGIGCAGFESVRTFFQKKGKIVAVYSGSPADLAGIKVGDTVVQNATDEAAKLHPDIPQWGVTLDRAGTVVETTLIRHGHPVLITCLRENIEDIKEPEVRRLWEKMVSELGYPKSGNFQGTSLDNLK